MKKILLLMLSVLMVQSEMFAETTPDGTGFSEGDLIMFAPPVLKNSLIGEYYQYVKYPSSYSESRHEWFYDEVHKSLAGRELRIVSMGPSKIFYNDHLVAKVGKGGRESFGKALAKSLVGISTEYYYVDLENALKSGEIILRTNPTPSKNPMMTDTLAFVYFMKDNGFDLNQYKEEYGARFRTKQFLESHEDEFEYGGFLEQSKKELSAKVNALDFDKTYSVLAEMRVGNYDFEKMEFPLLAASYNLSNPWVPLKQDTLLLRIMSRDWSQSSNLKESDDYDELYLMFPNAVDFASLKMSKEDANGFVKRRKEGWNRDVDRKVYAKINFKVKHLSDKEKAVQPNSLKAAMTKSIWCEIESIEFYEFENYQYNWLGTITKSGCPMTSLQSPSTELVSPVGRKNEINRTNCRDVQLFTYLCSVADKNGDKVISEEEASTVENLGLPEFYKFVDLDYVMAMFVNLKGLRVTSLNGSTLNLSKNILLKNLSFKETPSAKSIVLPKTSESINLKNVPDKAIENLADVKINHLD